MKKITVEDHLNNILFGLKNPKKTWEEHEVVKSSFIAIRDILIPKEEKKEIKEEPPTLP